MKKLDIKLLENGRLINVLREEVYDNENETLDVFVDYSNTEYKLWDKRCDIVVANGQKSIKLSDTFSLGREYLVQGVLQLQPIAFSGDKVVKFPITSIDISKSLNVVENDTTVTLSIAQEMLDDIELFKTGVNGELVAQNIKIDGLVLDTDTRLSEQDIRLGQQDTAITTNRTDILAEVDRRATIQDGVIDMWDDKITELDESRLTLKNEIENGDFSNGTAGWGTTSVTINALNNELKLTITGLNANSRIFQNINTIVGNKYYIHYQINAPKERTAGFNFSSIERKILTIPNEWTTISAVKTSLVSPQPLWCIYDTSVGYEIGDTYLMRNVICIDVTTAFGAGNEPTKEEMDRLVEMVPNGWWDGELTLEQKEVVQWLLKLESEKANKKQEEWITPTLLNGATGTVKYRKNGFGNVEFKGFVKALTTGVVFRLPNGYYEQSSSKLFLGADETSATNSKRVDVSGIGNVIVYHTTSNIYFDGINIAL